MVHRPASGGEELAGWSWYQLSEGQRLWLAARLEDVVLRGQGGDQAEGIAALARPLR